MHDFFDVYFRYTEETESPRIYHRWCAITSVGALLGRNFYFQHGHFRVFPNLYCMLIGDAGGRKSSAIKLAKKLLYGSGYDSIAATKTTKEKFLVDLEGAEEEGEIPLVKKGSKNIDAITNFNLWGDSKASDTPREVFVMADEFNDFIGINNLDFITTLGNLWDWDDENKPFESRLKNSRSVAIWQPTISILGGNTPENFIKAFPADILGQGFLSRLLLIYGEKRKSITFPPEPPKEETDKLTEFFKAIKQQCRGTATLTPDASKLLDEIYHSWQALSDLRFKSYSTRRFTQLLKLCLIIAASRLDTSISGQTVIVANTILAAAEHLMPRALGEFGKNKNSDVANKIMECLGKAIKPQTVKDMWKVVHKDLEKPAELATILQSLERADRIFHVPGVGYLSKAQVVRQQPHVDWNLITEEERKML